MLNRVTQPAMDPDRRDSERHDFWPGFVVVVIGAVLVFCGARHLTGVDTVDGGTASETQLIKSFSSGGLQYADRVAPVQPPKLDGVNNAAEALDRWASQQANAQPPSWKIRVDVGAETPCPT